MLNVACADAYQEERHAGLIRPPLSETRRIVFRMHIKDYLESDNCSMLSRSDILTHLYTSKHICTNLLQDILPFSFPTRGLVKINSISKNVRLCTVPWSHRAPAWLRDACVLKRRIRSSSVILPVNLIFGPHFQIKSFDSYLLITAESRSAC